MGNVRLSGARGIARALVSSAVIALGVAIATPQALAAKPAMDFAVEVLSGRADSIAGGDALVRVTVPRTVPMHLARVVLNGIDITAQFTTDGVARTMTALVSGLALGENDLAVMGPGPGNGRPAATLTLVNHPIEGPVFSGPHEQPFFCATQSFNLPAGLGNLGTTSDPNCHIPTRVDYIYRTTGGALAQWPAGATAYP